MATPQNQTPAPQPQAPSQGAYVPKVAPTYDVDIEKQLRAKLATAQAELEGLYKQLPAEQRVVLKGAGSTSSSTTNTVYPPPGSQNQAPSTNTTTTRSVNRGDVLSGISPSDQARLDKITRLEAEVSRLEGELDPSVLSTKHPPTNQQLLTHYVDEAAGQTRGSGPNIERLAGRLGDIEQGTSLDNIALRKALTNPAMEGSFGSFGRLLASVFNKNDPALMADYIRMLNLEYGPQIPGPGGTTLKTPLYGAGLRPGYEMRAGGAALVPETTPNSKRLATAQAGEQVAGQIAAEGAQPNQIPSTARRRVSDVNRAAGQGVQQLDTLVAGARAQIDKNRKLAAVTAAGTVVAGGGTATAVALKKGEYEDLTKNSQKLLFGGGSPNSAIASGMPNKPEEKEAFSRELGRQYEKYARANFTDQAKLDVLDAIGLDNEELFEGLADGHVDPEDLSTDQRKMIYDIWSKTGAKPGKPVIFPTFDTDGYQTGFLAIEQPKTPEDAPRVARLDKGNFVPSSKK